MLVFFDGVWVVIDMWLMLCCMIYVCGFGVLIVGYL